MKRTFLAGLLLLWLAVPAFSKTKNVHAVKGVYPVSCDDLWSAIKDTLHNHSNYGLSGVNDLDLTASFVVIGDLYVYTDRVALAQRDNGCEMKTEVHDVGAEPTNYRLFRSRVERSLGKVESAKTENAPQTSGKPNSTSQQ